MYGYERGTLRYNTDRPLYWDGMVGLAYPSDLGYAAGNMCVIGIKLNDYKVGCSQKDWLFTTGINKGLMTPDSGTSENVAVDVYDGIIALGPSNLSLEVHPSFYLTSNTLITNGDGSLNNPYLITLE